MTRAGCARGDLLGPPVAARSERLREPRSVARVRRSTQIKIASFFTEGGVVRTELLLRNGEIAATVQKSETTKSDFRIRAPTGGAGVRGTTFSLAYDPATRVTTTSVTEGQVEVQPLVFGDVEAPPVARGAAVMLSAGQEVRVSATAVGAVGAVGQSASPGASAALTKAQAVANVRQILRRNAGACELATKWVKARVTANGFRVSARVFVAGKKGTAIWNVARGEPKAFNALAGRIQRGCA